MTSWLKRAALTVRSLFPIRAGAGAIAIAVALATPALAQTCPNTLTGATAVPAWVATTDPARPAEKLMFLLVKDVTCTISGLAGSVASNAAPKSAPVTVAAPNATFK